MSYVMYFLALSLLMLVDWVKVKKRLGKKEKVTCFIHAVVFSLAVHVTVTNERNSCFIDLLLFLFGFA